MSYAPYPNINSLTKIELLQLLKECFYLVGKNTSSLTPEEADTIWREVTHWQGSVWVDTFREAFSAYAAGIIEIEGFNPTVSPMSISRIQKAYREKTYGKKEKQLHKEGNFIPSPDEGYYNSLVCVMNGEKSERYKQHNPHGANPPGMIIPATWDWGRYIAI